MKGLALVVFAFGLAIQSAQAQSGGSWECHAACNVAEIGVMKDQKHMRMVTSGAGNVCPGYGDTKKAAEDDLIHNLSNQVHTMQINCGGCSARDDFKKRSCSQITAGTANADQKNEPKPGDDSSSDGPKPGEFKPTSPIGH